MPRGGFCAVLAQIFDTAVPGGTEKNVFLDCTDKNVVFWRGNNKKTGMTRNGVGIPVRNQNLSQTESRAEIS